jgi:GGDEF domain-containing protein
MPVPEQEAAIRLAERLIADVGVPYCIEGRTIGINVSVGIALASECGEGEVLLRAADEASYEAKRAGKGALPPRPPQMLLAAYSIEMSAVGTPQTKA